MRLLYVVAATALLAANAAHANKMYQWTDANGVVHFSDKAPASSAVLKKEPKPVTVEYSQTPYNNQAEERWHGALREHGVQIRTITIPAHAPTHSNPTGR